MTHQGYNKCLLSELMSPSALLGNLAQNREELITLNFAVSKWKGKTGRAGSFTSREGLAQHCVRREGPFRPVTPLSSLQDRARVGMAKAEVCGAGGG